MEQSVIHGGEQDFPQREYEQRTLKAQALMKVAHIDALLLMNEPQVRYFTGFRTLFWQSPTRPWFVVVPREGKPIAIVPEIGASLMQNTWVDDIRTWSSPHQDDDGVSLLHDVLAPFQRIGLMMGRESSLRMPLNDFNRLQIHLRGAEFVDASPLIAALHFVKSESEIEKIKTICTIACDAFDQAQALFFPGQPLVEVFRQFKIALLQQGAEDVPYLVGGCGPNGYDDVISPPTVRPLEVGDVLMLDTGACLHGYFCDFDRNFAIGQAPSDAVKKAQDTLWQATRAGFEAARPGARCCDIFAAMQKVINQQGNDVGRLGHGLGMQLTQTPSIINWDETVMQEGAVMTLEPSIAVEGGGVLVHEENIVIRDGPPQWLTRPASQEMPVIV